MKKIIIILFIVTINNIIFAQNDSSAKLQVSGYAEIYYLLNFNMPDNNTQPGFIYSHNRHNEFNLNLGFIKAAYATDRVRANLSLMAGTYANANLAAEPGVLKNIYEANAGFKISKENNVWIDAGILPSHIGFESAISKDCATLTRSILAENSPYYESGVRLSYTSDNNKWFLAGLLLNGWQRIQRVEGNSLISGGTQITYKPTDNITLNSSTFIGTDKPDTDRKMRYFHNFYGIFNLSDKFSATAGFDFGFEQTAMDTSEYNNWYSPVIILKYAINNKHAIAARGEYYADENEVIIATGFPDGFKASGFSLNYDCKITENSVWRIEGRIISASDSIFVNNEEIVKILPFATTSFAISF
ncbi:MAG: porin [Fimbriimonadaceae bacterium]|nr:porin [Chitinophagales bacterium]